MKPSSEFLCTTQSYHGMFRSRHPVRGYPVEKILDGFEWFVYKAQNPEDTLDPWFVCEVKSGLSIGGGKTRKEAIESARQRVADVIEKKGRRYLNKQIKMKQQEVAEYPIDTEGDGL